MQQELEARLKGPINLPSPPVVAQRIIDLAQDPEVDVTRVADMIGKDPSLTAKILRTANSPIYAQRRRSQNLRQAVLVLGLNATTNLALSFSIVAGLKSSAKNGMDYPTFWRRCMLTALTSRIIGEALGSSRTEDLFLAGLLQDIGILTLDRIKPGFYNDLPRDANSEKRIAYERERVGSDHAAVGGWLLNTWNLPEHLGRTVALSHCAEQTITDIEDRQFVRCVALAGELTEMLLSAERREILSRLSLRAYKLLGLRREQLGEIMSHIARLAPETEQLFEMDILDAESINALMDQAREILAMRSLHSLSELESLRVTTHSLVARTQALEDETRHDGLTRVYNRTYLDQRLGAEFETARNHGWPFSVAFVDLDHFKRINDTYGHQAGDEVLRSTAQCLLGAVRDTDLVARYGGEEFVVIFPGLDNVSALRACERILSTLRTSEHHAGGQTIKATASIGIATHSMETPLEDVSKLMHAADMALYCAKRSGRNRVEAFFPSRLESASMVN